jgi:hypothetical protein
MRDVGCVGNTFTDYPSRRRAEAIRLRAQALFMLSARLHNIYAPHGHHTQRAGVASWTQTWCVDGQNGSKKSQYGPT